MLVPHPLALYLLVSISTRLAGEWQCDLVKCVLPKNTMDDPSQGVSLESSKLTAIHVLGHHPSEKTLYNTLQRAPYLKFKHGAKVVIPKKHT